MYRGKKENVFTNIADMEDFLCDYLKKYQGQTVHAALWHEHYIEGSGRSYSETYDNYDYHIQDVEKTADLLTDWLEDWIKKPDEGCWEFYYLSFFAPSEYWRDDYPEQTVGICDLNYFEINN